MESWVGLTASTATLRTSAPTLTPVSLLQLTQALAQRGEICDRHGETLAAIWRALLTVLRTFWRLSGPRIVGWGALGPFRRAAPPPIGAWLCSCFLFLVALGRCSAEKNPVFRPGRAREAALNRAVTAVNGILPIARATALTEYPFATHDPSRAPGAGWQRATARAPRVDQQLRAAPSPAVLRSTTLGAVAVRWSRC